MQKETYVAPKLEKQEPLQDITTQILCGDYLTAVEHTYEDGQIGSVCVAD